MRALYCLLLVLASANLFAAGSATDPGGIDPTHWRALGSNPDIESTDPLSACTQYVNQHASVDFCNIVIEDSSPPDHEYRCKWHINNAQSGCTSASQFSTLQPRWCTAPEIYNEDADRCEPYCPEGQEWNDVTQQCEQTCDGDEVYYAAHNACGPECEEPEVLNVIGIGGNKQLYCGLDFPEPPEADECEDIEGYYTDENGVQQQVCNDGKDDCEAAGGTWGYAGVGNNLEGTCSIPDDPIDCSDGAIIYDIDNGTYTCEPLTPRDDPDDPDVPDSTTPDPLDTDDDGIPDKDDPDIDGDGINNGIDPDIDGDGINNEDDPTPNGDDPEGEGEGNVSGGGSCQQRPQCTGDPVQCAILYQTWAARCQDGTQTVSGGGDCESSPECKGDKINCAILVQTWEARCASPFETQDELDDLVADLTVDSLVQPEEDLTSTLQDVYTASGSSGTCPAPYNLNLNAASVSFDYGPICDLGSYLKPIVLLAFGFLAFRQIMRAF